MPVLRLHERCLIWQVSRSKHHPLHVDVTPCHRIGHPAAPYAVHETAGYDFCIVIAVDSECSTQLASTMIKQEIAQCSISDSSHYVPRGDVKCIILGHLTKT